MKRIFIAINLPEEIKEKLTDLQKKYKNLPVRWVKKENLHITLCFLGDTKEKDIGLIGRNLKIISKELNSFEVYLNKIHPGPNKNHPRMLWVSGPISEDLRKLQRKVTDSVKDFINEERDFKLHITLARALKDSFGRIKKIPWFLDKINLAFKVSSFDLMESKLSMNGAEYKVLEKFIFQ